MVITMSITLAGVDVDVDVEFNPGWFQRGSRRGHPDNWTPDEGEPAEIERVALTLESGRVVDLTRRLPKDTMERIQRKCDAYEPEPPEPDYEPDDYYDD